MRLDSPARKPTNPQEEALQLFCKQMLKSKLFKGLYKERFYVDEVKGYRDLIIINRNEKELNTVLNDIKSRLKQFYLSTSIWIGITNTLKVSPNANPETYIWVELDELAFNQYWFSIKSVKFRENEIILKVKPIRPVEQEPDPELSSQTTRDSTEVPNSISLHDFIKVIMSWGTSIKQAAYDFLSNDISKENLIAIVKFSILMFISLLTFSVEAVRFFGIFTIRFMMEFRKLLAVCTPLFMGVIELCSKIIGGFYILLAMIWRDVKSKPPQQTYENKAITYNNTQVNHYNTIAYSKPPLQEYQRRPIAYNSPIYRRIKEDLTSEYGSTTRNKIF